MKKIIYLIIAVLIFTGGRFLLKEDFGSFVQWWLTCLYIGIIFLPLISLLFDNFHDKGYLFSKTIGLAIAGYQMWLAASLHILKFNTFNCMIVLFICLLANIGLLYIRVKRKPKVNLLKMLLKDKLLDTVIAQELLFLALFLLFTYIRGFKPEAYGTEKFMDYGFMTSMLRSEYMPPQDFWYSGTSLNYYYLGQYLASFLTRISFVKVSVGYNLMLMMVAAFAVTLAYTIVYNVIRQFITDKAKKSRVLPIVSGAIGGIAVCIAGNMHYPAYKWFEPMIRKFFGMEKSSYRYWFPDATRFIGYHPETNDKTIHEFPCYSFVLGDLHAHVINIMFVLTVVGLLFAWMIARRKNGTDKFAPLKELLNPQLILISFFIGMFRMTNYWDLAIYYVVSGAVILFTNMVVYNFKGRAVIYTTAAQGVFVLALSSLISLPFILSFDKIATTILPTYKHTPLSQLIILWGLPLFVFFSYLCFMIADIIRKRKTAPDYYEIRGRIKRIPFIRNFFIGLTPSDMFIITIGLCAAGLVLLPELVYVEDIYSSDYSRANTMFKLTYQAFILFGLSMGYIFIRLLAYGGTRKRIRYSIIGLALFAMSVCYAQNAVNSWYGDIFKITGYKGLDATAFMEQEMPEDKAAIDWLNENVTTMPVVLEANGNSYTDYQRVSVMTGLPTILGWRTHEWLWKSSEDMVKFREDIVDRIYCATDEEELRSLLKEYNVSYIYVGKLEKEKFPLINEELLQSIGEKVYSSPDTITQSRLTYIIKVEP